MAVKTCVVCGAEFTAGPGMARHSTAITCSKACGKARDRDKSRARAAAYREDDPEYTRRIVEWRRERMRTDPEFRRRENQRAALRVRERYRDDPAFRARVLAALREYVRENRERIRARWRERYRTDPAFRAHELAKARAWYRKHRRRQGAGEAATSPAGAGRPDQATRPARDPRPAPG